MSRHAILKLKGWKKLIIAATSPTVPCFVPHLKMLFPDFLFRSHSFNVHTPLKKEKIQDPPVEHDLYVTLEEINSGCVKKMKIARRVLQPDGTPKKEDKYVSISVKPGWKSGTKVTFQKEGDQTKGKIPSDIVFIIRDKPHPLFRREGSDLRYTARLTLKQVSCKHTFYARSVSFAHFAFPIRRRTGERWNINLYKVIERSHDDDASNEHAAPPNTCFCCFGYFVLPNMIYLLLNEMWMVRVWMDNSFSFSVGWWWN